MQFIAVITTVDQRESADALCRHLVENRLVACAQISAIDSYYQWQGQLQHESEFRLLFKTTSARYHEVEAAIKSLHPYQLPAIVALPFSHVEPAFAAWLQQQTHNC
jgi:periplasmic divalent cation tolerance protein